MQKSAEKGVVEAQYHLGLMYYNGKGTQKDKKIAAYCVREAFENGYEEAKIFWEQKKLWKY